MPRKAGPSRSLWEIGDSSEPKNELSVRFIEKIKAMNTNMEIPSKVAELKEEDIPLIAKRALRRVIPGIQFLSL